MKEIDQFLDYLRVVKRYSENTICAYANDLNGFVSHCIEVEFIDDVLSVTPKMIRRWEMLLVDSGMKATSVKRKVSSLKTFFRFLEREGIVSGNPTEMIVAPKTPKQLPVFVTEDRMDNLLDSSFFGNDYVGVRDRFLLMMAYCTGMRRSEIVGLKLSDLDLANKVFRVHGKGNKQRLVPILDELRTMIEEYLSIRERYLEGVACDFFFLNDKKLSLTDKQLYRIVVDYLSRVTTQTKKSPHVLRHSFATAMLNNGASIEAISELLGHSSLAATQVYTHNSFENLKKVFNQAHPRAKN